MELKEEKKEKIKKKADKINKIIAGVTCCLFFGFFMFGQSLIAFILLGVGLISNIIYEVIKNKKKGGD